MDIDLRTYNATPDAIAAAITPRTRLVLAVHTFGFPIDVIGIREVLRVQRPATSKRTPNVRSTRASGRGTIHIIEDACEALGADVRGHKAGTLGSAGLFAFYPNKLITTGEGGVLVTADARIAAQAERLRNQGRDGKRGLNEHVEVGFSYRISDINCALGISQLSRIESVIARRQKLAETYDRALAGIPDVIRPALTSSVGRISWFVYSIRLARDFTAKQRDWLCESLAKKGIATGRYFAPLHKQVVLRKYFAELRAGKPHAIRRSNFLPNTDAVADRVLALPFFNELTESEIYEVAGALDESIRELRRKM